MKIKTFLPFLLTSFYCFSQNPINESFKAEKLPQDEEHNDYYRNGQLNWSYIRRNGNLEGLYIHYLKNGQVEDSSNFENGHYNGVNRTYDHNGNLREEEIFRRDTLLYYKQMTYYKNGNKKSIRYIEMNKDSLKLFPFKNTQIFYLKSRVVYDYNESVKNMKSKGQIIIYFKNGTIKEEGGIVNNNYEGTYKINYKTGKPKVVFTFLNNKLNGLTTDYYENGNIKMETSYLNDKLDGPCTYYYKSGEINRTDVWKNNKPVK